MKKVLFIHHGGIEGGAPLSLLYTALGVAKSGYTPEVGLMYPSKELHALYNKNGIVTHELPFIPFFIVWTGHSPHRFSIHTLRDIVKTAKKWNSAQSKLIEFIELHNFDLVHLNSAALSNAAQILLRKNIPFVWHVREQGPAKKGLRFKFIHALLAASKNVIFLSEAERKSWGFESHGSVIHNFIDFELFDFHKNTNRFVCRKEFGISANDFVILFMGGLKHYKGTELLIRAVARLTHRFPEIKILMPDSVEKKTGRIRGLLKKIMHKFNGSSNYPSHIVALIHDLNLIDNCIRLPFNPNSISFYVSSDVVVFPATQAHFARPIIEASAMKIPVLASDFPVMRELVVNEETGYLFEPNNIEELSQKLEVLLLSKELRSSMGENGYMFAWKNFDSNIQMNKVLNVYAEALSNEFQH